MAKCKAVLLSLGLFGIVYFIQLSSYKTNLCLETKVEEKIPQVQENITRVEEKIPQVQENITRVEEKIPQVQDLRKQLLQEQCDKDIKAFSHGKHSLDDLSESDLRNFIVDDKNGIIYCYVPKVACTNWKRVLTAIKHSEPYPDPVSIGPGPVHNPEEFTLLSSSRKMEMKLKLRYYTKFMFVREPFIRLISAYRDKFLQENAYYYEEFGKHILRRYGNVPNPPKTDKEAFALGIRPSFYNFIQYLLDPKTEISEPFEPHWRQMHHLCHPCLIKYDFIGHQETLKNDAQELLRMLKLEGKIKFPPVYGNTTSSNSVLPWFRAVPLTDRRRLYRLYEQDFKLFGYRRPSEVLDG